MQTRHLQHWVQFVGAISDEYKQSASGGGSLDRDYQANPVDRQ
jgi:hypothetical protein